MTPGHDPPTADKPGKSQKSPEAKRVKPVWAEDALAYLEQLIEASGLPHSDIERYCSLEPGTIRRWRRHPEEISPAAYLETGEWVARATPLTEAEFFFEVYMTVMLAKVRAGEISGGPIFWRLEPWVAFVEKLAEIEPEVEATSSTLR